MPDVHLTPQMQDFAERLVAEGIYADFSDVVRAGMRRLMEERDGAAFRALRAELNAAADELERGGGEPFDPRAWKAASLQGGDPRARHIAPVSAHRVGAGLCGQRLEGN